jgi:hypothetical protein
VWRQDEPQSDVPYAVVLNRKTVINKSKQTPYQHGECSIQAIRNVMVPGHFYGSSELSQTANLYREANTLRSLRLDAVTLSTLPVYTKLNGIAMPELHRHLRPGNSIPVPRHDVLRRLDLGNASADSFREMSEIKNDIDETNATGQNVRGGTATVGRVSATETQGRVTQALLRTKLTAVLISEDMVSSINQIISIWQEKGDTELLKRISGAGSPMSVSPGQLYEALAIDFRFRGPTRALNREMQAQQLQQFGQAYGQGWLTPEEMRALMKLQLEAIGLRGSTKLVTSKGTEMLTQQWMQKSGLAQQAGAVQGMQQSLQQETLAPSGTPATIPGGEPAGGQAPEGGEAPPQ